MGKRTYTEGGRKVAGWSSPGLYSFIFVSVLREHTGGGGNLRPWRVWRGVWK